MLRVGVACLHLGGVVPPILVGICVNSLFFNAFVDFESGSKTNVLKKAKGISSIQQDIRKLAEQLKQAKLYTTKNNSSVI